MKLYILILWFITFAHYSQAQSITLRILGQSNYTEYAESNVVLLSVQQHDITKIEALKDSLTANGLDNTVVKVATSKNQQITHYKFENQDLNTFDNVLVWCSALQINVYKVYFKMPEHQFKNEDDHAVLALKNANTQAKILANHLGYKIETILNIDDETTYANPIYDTIDFDSSKGQRMLKFLELLSNRDVTYDTKSNSPSKSGGYNIWVTYRLTKT
ncbi:hypothetical protein [Olleya sp. UBA1516]|uniref:hypothetical protein n=1 Tax=Olleya sp. UBA1516 TaxID=1947013 RepID=UPI0025CF7E58|nr:hypothetical protein [Olleya sp. UBA1516]|tara:strand:- start:3132 stop:3782 length:651 start_codon:yes stop_codon:yes gene_type:complete